MNPRRVLLPLAGLSLLTSGSAGAHHDGALPYGQVLEPGFIVTPYATGIPSPTSLEFGPDGDLYVASVTGTVFRFDDIGAPVPAPGEPTPIVTGLQYSLGLDFGPDGSLYVTAVDPDADNTEREWSMVGRVRFDALGVAAPLEKLLVDIPNGLSFTNSVAFGPDGDLYVTNGSSTDDGFAGGPPEVPNLTGAILRFDPEDVGDRPLSALAYRGSGVSDPDPVDVVAHGLRNSYDLAFRGEDLYLTMNGPDAQEPYGDDLLLRVRNARDASLGGGTAADFGFPGCLYTHDDRGFPVAHPATAPWMPEEQRTCEGAVPPIASFGLHPSANGLAIAPDGFGPFGGDAFAAEWGSFQGYEGHKIVRVGLNADGSAAATSQGAADVSDFLAAVAPMDLTFHDGAMYVADFGSNSVLRVTPVPTTPAEPVSHAHVIVRNEYLGSGTTSNFFTGSFEGLYGRNAGYVVRRGDRITFTNLDQQPHTVTACSNCDPFPTPNNRFRSPYLFTNQAWTLDTASLEPGTYKYFCQHHVYTMRGSLTVV